jgi:hypothetical protein
MPIAKKAAAEQIKRMNGLNFRPMDAEAVTEITDTLAQVAHSSDDAAEIVTAWLSNTNPDENCQPLGKRFPTPVELITLARKLVEHRRSNGAPAGCEACAYTGWRPIEKAQPNTVLTYVRGVRYCDCSLGIWRRQKQTENRGAA